MRSQDRLARNLEGSPKGSTATWKIKRGSILSRHTNIQPQQLLPTERKRRHTSKRSGWHLTSCTILRPPSPPTRDLASPGPGCRQAGPKLHTTLGRSRQPGEAKLSFHKTRPHPQEGSQPFVWKKRGLLVLTSSSLPSRPTCGPAPRCLPLPDHFSGHQLPDATRSPRGVARRSAFLLPRKLGSWRHTLPRGHVPLLQQAAATAWPAVSLFCPRSLRGPSNAALPNIAFLKPRPLLIFSFPSPCTLISPASSSNSAIALILAPEALNWPLPPTHLGPKETLPVTNSYYTGHNFCLYSPWPHHPGHCSTGRFLHATGKEVRPRPCPRRRFGAVLGLPGRPSPGPAPTPQAQQGFMTPLPDLKVTLRRRILGA